MTTLAKTGATLFHLPGRQSDLDNLLKYVATRTIRPVISNTPVLGMKTAATVLGDKKLKALWLNDLDEAAEEMIETRILVANKLAEMDYCDPKAIEVIRNGRGLFFLLPTPEGVTPEALVTHLNQQGVFPALFPDGSIRCSLGGFSSATPEETEAKVARFTDALACCPTPGLRMS